MAQRHALRWRPKLVKEMPFHVLQAPLAKRCQLLERRRRQVQVILITAWAPVYHLDFNRLVIKAGLHLLTTEWIVVWVGSAHFRVEERVWQSNDHL